MNNRILIGLAGAAVVIGLCVVAYVSRDSSSSPSWGQHAAQLDELSDEMKKAMDKITRAHGAGHCESDSQCRVVGLGQKTCGGYNNFLIYSTYDASDSLPELVDQYNEAATKFNNLSLQVPPCGEQPQAIVCSHQDCVPR